MNTNTFPPISLMSIDALENCNLINQDLYDFMDLDLYGMKDGSPRKFFVSTKQLEDVLGAALLRKVECEVTTYHVFPEDILSHKPFFTDYISTKLLN